MNNTRLVWRDRTGRQLDAIHGPAHYLSPALSPDRSRVAVDLLDIQRETIDTWIIDLARGVSSRSTVASTVDGSPLWSLDGKRIVFASERNGLWTLRERMVDQDALTRVHVGRVRPARGIRQIVFRPDPQVADLG